jgi:hypothetical protein
MSNDIRICIGFKQITSNLFSGCACITRMSGITLRRTFSYILMASTVSFA